MTEHATEQRSNRQDLTLLLALFIGSRLMILAAFTPESIIAYGDFEHFFNLARLTDQGYYPFLNYWYEYPPLFPLVSITTYRLTAAVTGLQHSYIYALALVMLAFDAGCLVLLFRLANRLWGERIASQTAWVYLVLPVGMIYTWRNFDSMTAFWMLLALDWLLAGKEKRAGLALGIGVMVKIMPALILPSIWAYRPNKKALTITLITLAVVVLVFGPLIIASPQFSIASLKAQLAKSSWQTAWALIDGNLSTGNVGPDIEHFDIKYATKLLGNPERIPGWLSLVPFACAGLYLFLLARRKSPGGQADSRPAQSLVSFFLLTFIIFLLWSKGWSPQWQMLLLPLVLLAFPGRNGILWCVLFGLVNFLEWPVLLSRGLTQGLWITVIARTIMLAALAVPLVKKVLIEAKLPPETPHA